MGLSSSNTKTKITRDKSNCINIEPSNYDCVIIFCHGLGDTGEGWLDVAQQWNEKLPFCKIILPTAPVQPVTLNLGMPMNSWFDIKGISEEASLNCPGIESTRDFLNQLINKETKKGIKKSRIVLGGFSQGGALSLFTALGQNELGGVILLSSWIPCLNQIQWNLPSKTPILQAHGKQDNMVPFAFGKKTMLVLEQKQFKVDFTSYSNLGHSACVPEVQEVGKFLSKVLPKQS